MRAREFVNESVGADKVLQYVKRVHAPDEFNIEYSITDYPEWELKRIPIAQLKLDPDGEAVDPYNRVNWIDYDKVEELVPRIKSVLEKNPIVVNPQGWIIDGNHRATAAVEAGMTDIPAYVPVTQNLSEDLYGVKRNVTEFLDSLTPDDVGVDRVGPYRIHYEGFTDDCQSSQDYCRDPDRVYQQVFADHIRREKGQQPVEQGMVGDEEYPILYSIFRAKGLAESESTKSGIVQTEVYGTRAYHAKCLQPGCDWQSKRYDRIKQAQIAAQKHAEKHVGKKDVAEGKDFDQCFDQACKLYDKAEHKNLEPKLVQVADFQGDGSGADPRWTKLPQHVWQHYVVIVGDQVLDPTAQQFGPDMPTRYPVSDLDQLWGKQYQIRPTEGVVENFADGKVKGKSRPGRVKRAGASCAGSVTDLRAKAKKYGGERGKMYHWCANMKGGRK